MPFYKVLSIRPSTKLYLWKITEDFNQLYREVKLKEVSLARLEGMKSESHQKGFMAVRLLLQHLGYTDFDLYHDGLGKPYLNPNEGFAGSNNGAVPIHISISHSHGFSGLLVSDENVGLDIEQLKEKTLRIAPRFMDMSHLEGLSETQQVQKATVIWGIKEAVFKIKSETGISFPDHIAEEPFTLEDKKTTAKLQFNNRTECFDAVFGQEENYVYVCAFVAGPTLSQ